ncbi:MAG: Heat shock protein HslJ [Desulfovibrio sp.]
MKYFRKLTLLAAFLSLFAAVSCAGGKNMQESDLLHRTFVLETVDGQPFAASLAKPEIAFGENFRVYGQVCNRYTGQGTLTGNVLTVSQMASTKMLCADDALNKLEYEFSQLLMDGMAVELSGDTLSLEGGGRTLTFKASGSAQQ